MQLVKTKYGSALVDEPLESWYIDHLYKGGLSTYLTSHPDYDVVCPNIVAATAEEAEFILFCAKRDGLVHKELSIAGKLLCVV